MRASFCLALTLLAAASLAPRAASAEEDVEQAKALFNAGAQAYAATRYGDAVQSFEAAYKKAPRPALLFSLAQAYRRLYAVEQSPEALRAAIANYRRYLEQVPQGGRRADAAEALSELAVIAARLDATAAAAPAAPAAAEVKAEAPPEVRPRARISVTSPTAGARVSLDGRPPVDVPMMAEVEPGKHRIRITAEGYVAEEREVVAVEGDLTGIDRELREMPALLEVKSPRGVEVTLDGRLLGTTPLPLIQVAPGTRFIVAMKNGHKPFSRALSLGRGERRVVEVVLSSSVQRKVSYGLFAVGTLSAGVGAMTALASLEHQDAAREIAGKRNERGISERELKEYEQQLGERDDLANASSALLSTAATFWLGGLALYLFDTPSPPPPPLPARTEPSPSRPGGPMLELSATPILGPGLGGVGLSGRFW
ncbi:PEGA domain-containing protein [Sorangium sp. So ce131]|uniref:PEGA domain-containing protein n=1 Tax=Sorangium sp. So ce131 TaxID=3133282 RepID=UPI003F5EAB83